MTDFIDHDIIREDRPDGTVILRSAVPLGPVARNTTEWLARWAREAPDRVFLAERDGEDWATITFAEMWDAARAVGQGLLDNGISPGDAVVALSGASIDHGILMLACHMIGAPIVPLAEQYALIPDAHARLSYCAGKVRAAMVFAADGATFADALALPVFDDALKVTGTGHTDLSFADLCAATPGPALDAAMAAITHDTVAKILFTSGSTSNPKGVPNTQRMICTNQAQYLASLPILGRKHHKMLDWLPWNHTFAGNSNFYMMLSNGGSYYIDGGKPLPGLFDTSLDNARHVPVTLGFDVPLAHGLRVAAMQEDAKLRHTYFRDLDIFLYAGAALPADVWAAFEDMARAERGDVPLMMSSWGMTETAPSMLILHEKGGGPGNVGVPVPGAVIKLLPTGENRWELRCSGPNVFEGYLDDPQKTAAAFDDEGFLVTGDCVGMVDPAEAARGLFFDGRLSEDFKLASGTWVQASMLRLTLLPRLKGLAQDLVITGEGRNQLGLLLFAPPGRGQGGQGAVTDAAHMAEVAQVLGDLAASTTGSSNRITRAILMAEPPSMGEGEITAKGSLNIRAILDRRADLVTRLYDDTDPAVIFPAT